ncbi:MAG: TIGR02588 family protein [Phormidesmis sp.]
MNQPASKAQPDSSKPRDQSQSVAEQISFLLAAAVVLAVLGGVGYLWVRDRNQGPPALQVTSNIEQRQGNYYIPFTVINTGGETAEMVQVIAELRIDGVLVEWGDQQINFLSSQEEASGAFILTQDPDIGELTVRVASYQDP